MEFNRLKPAIRSLWMSISVAKLNMHLSVKPTENSEATLHTGSVGNEKSLSSIIICTAEELVITSV